MAQLTIGEIIGLPLGLIGSLSEEDKEPSLPIRGEIRDLDRGKRRP